MHISLEPIANRRSMPPRRGAIALALGALLSIGGLTVLATPSSTRASSGEIAPPSVVCPTVRPGQTLHYGQTTPVVVAHLPAALPCVGLQLDQDAVLLPLAKEPGMLTLREVMDTAHITLKPGSRIAGAFLASVTLVSTLPSQGGPIYFPGTHTAVIWHPIRDRPAWYIEIASSTPLGEGSGGPAPPPGVTVTPHPPDSFYHSFLALDAYSGELLGGMMTR